MKEAKRARKTEQYIEESHCPELRALPKHPKEDSNEGERCR
jgi:hypothetical protein